VINPIVKIATDLGPIIIDLMEVVIIAPQEDAVVVAVRSGDSVTIHIKDAEARLELIDDLYAKKRKIHEENVRLLQEMNYEG
jgi:rhodanese-related sulfurtransferase